MGTYKNKAYPLRIDEELQNKLDIISSNEGRTKNKQIEHIIKMFVYQYEQIHGEIKLQCSELNE